MVFAKGLPCSRGASIQKWSETVYHTRAYASLSQINTSSSWDKYTAMDADSQDAEPDGEVMSPCGMFAHALLGSVPTPPKLRSIQDSHNQTA